MVRFDSIDNLVSVPQRTHTYGTRDEILNHYALPFGISYTENPTSKMIDDEYEKLPVHDRDIYVPQPLRHEFSTSGSRSGRVIYVIDNAVKVEFEMSRMSKAAILAGRSHGCFKLCKGERTIIPPGMEVVIHTPEQSRFLDIPISRYELQNGSHMEKNQYLKATYMESLREPSMTNIDARRSIIDVTERVKVFSIADAEGLKLGNHFHRKMKEWYFLVSGSQEWILDSRKERRRHKLIPKEMITVPRHVAHVVMPAPQTEFIGIIDRNFDAGDLHKYEF